MTRSRHSRPSRSVAAATHDGPHSFDDNPEVHRNSNEKVSRLPSEQIDEEPNEPVPENDQVIPTKAYEHTNLKSNVWKYAKKISKAEARCIKCKAVVKTPGGGTSTLRKHLVKKHNLTHLLLRAPARSHTNDSLPREQKGRLDYLAYLAIFEDGRTFGDLQKPGIAKFLAEAIPGLF